MRTMILVALAALGMTLGGIVAGCTAQDRKAAAEHAEQAVIDCGTGELSHLKPIAISMVKPLTEGTLTQDELEATAVSSGARYGGCLLKNLYDVFPREYMLVGAPTPAERALAKLREATHTTAKYRTDAGEL